ncbi:MAG: hypothetical protein ACREP6_07195, partial [Candidatus Binataceae bacterium]
GTITLYGNNRVLENRAVVVPPGQTRFDFNVTPRKSGLIAYRTVFKPDNPALDQYKENDSEQGWVGIGARHRVLILTGSQRDANYLETVVRRMGFEPQVVTLTSGQYDGSLKDYAAIFLNNVPSARIAPREREAIVSYVRAGG